MSSRASAEDLMSVPQKGLVVQLSCCYESKLEDSSLWSENRDAILAALNEV